MGNSPSNVNSDSDEEEGDALQDMKNLNGPAKDELDSCFDLGVLFDHKLLREATSKIKEEPVPSILQQYHGHLVRWVEERRSRNEETITLPQFTDMLVLRGAERDDAVELFNQFDVEGEGVIEREILQSAITNSGSGIGQKGELRTVLKNFTNCSICPGMIDAFVANKHSISDHGKRLLKVILRSRASSSSIATPVVEGFCNTAEMRLKVLHYHLQTMKEKANLKKTEPSCEAGEFLRPLTKCFSSTETSSSKADAFRLTNGDSNTYWQSDGPARSHWIRLRMRSNVVIKELSIQVASADQSYMPQRVVVSGGRDEINLRDLNDVRIPSHVTGSIVLLENVKMPYPVIQINIRRCHSDGCDTRIHGVNAVGYRVVKSKGVSVADATAVWYLSVLTSTASLTMPMAPQLRTQIINHTRDALGHMVPLSLSPTSPVRPVFLSTSVLDEMEKFLYFIASYDNNLDSEGMQILIEFSLARGNLGGIFNVLKLLYDNLHLKFTAKNIVSSLVNEQERTVQRHGGKLNVSFIGCNGGAKDTNSLPKNVLSENWSTEAYQSETGKVFLSMAFSSECTSIVQLTKITLKVCKGDTGPRCGLIFMRNDVQIENGELDVKHLDKYNCWNSTVYQEYLKNTQRRQPGEDDPVAFFTMDSEWDEIDIPLDRPAVGKFIIVKFMGARNEKADNLGILGIQFYGYEKTVDEIQDSANWKNLTSISENASISGSVLFIQVLLFLDCMTKDLKNCVKKKTNPEVSEKEPRMDMTKMSLKHLWDVYSTVMTRDDENKEFASILVLRLFHQALPYLRHDVQEKSHEDSKELSTRVFKHLCEVVDDNKGTYNKKLVQITKDIILDGTEVFFPDADTRRGHLLSMVDEVMGESKLQSLALTFESLCKFFSNKDASGLLGLPNNIPQTGFDIQSVLSVMSTLVSVAYQECKSSLQSDYDLSEERKTSNLVQLLSAMQKSLLTWCSSQIGMENHEGKKVAILVVTRYTSLIADKTCLALKAIDHCKTKDEAVTILEHSFVAYTFRQMILFLNTFSPIEEIVLPVLHNLQTVTIEIRRIAEDLPRYFLEANSNEQMKKSDCVILRTWEMESSHNYENNQNFTKVFNCPGCSEFLVQFDSRCETERRYDYLEFTDSNGAKKRFDQKVGTEKWPAEVVFQNGNKLQFLFHSDGSNNEWGYKFKVTARGCPDITLSWLFDLQLGLASLFGLFCSSVMAGFPKGGKKDEKTKVEGDAALLQSKIWTTLFRGSYTNYGKLQRSLSGHHATTFSVDKNILGLCNGIATDTAGKCLDLVNRCQSECGQPSIGGKNVDDAVRCVFAALVWHSQRLREEINVAFASLPVDISAGISEAYKTAESLRRNLVEARQKLVLEAEQGKEKNGKTVVPDDVVNNCKEKALFLLGFSGLTRIASSSTDTKDKQGSSLTSKKFGFNRISIHNRRQNKLSSENTKVMDKYPSFQFILDFVTNSEFSHHRVGYLLQERTKFACNLSDIYLFAAEYISMFSKPDIFQAPVVMFLQQMLVHQKRFPSHYGDNLDGCGLDLEGRVRNAYYTLLRRLLDSVRSYTGDPEDGSPCSMAFSCIRAYLLHFLDIEWKSYDLTFLNDNNLPEFFLATTKGTVSALQQNSTEISNKREIEEYKMNMAWKDEATKGFHRWWDGMQNSVTNPEEKRKLHLFLSRFTELFEVDVFCDGCKCALEGRRYRCLNCFEIDLCPSCYGSDVKPSGHTSGHEVAELRWRCDNCRGFIIGTRFHCNECNDFDLCLGCQTAHTWPESHLITHSMTKYPKKSDISISQRIPAYTHTHAWYQFAVLSLSLASALNDPIANDTYGDYILVTDNLHSKCLILITKCLNEALKTAEADAREEKKRIEVIDQQSEAEARKTAPSEGAFSEEKSEILKSEDVSKESASKAAVESDEVVGITSVENAKKDTSVHSEFPKHGLHDKYKQPTLVTDVASHDNMNIENREQLHSAELDKLKEARHIIQDVQETTKLPCESDDKSNMEEATYEVSSFHVTSSRKIDLQSPTEHQLGSTNESVKNLQKIKNRPEAVLALQDITEATLPGGANYVSVELPSNVVHGSSSGTLSHNLGLQARSESGACSSEHKAMLEDKENAYLKTETDETNLNNSGDPIDLIARTSGVGEGKMDTKHENISVKSSQSNFPVFLERQKLTAEQTDSLFYRETQEKLLGLIGAMLPKDSKLSHWTIHGSSTENFLITEFLPILFKIIRSPDVLFEFRNMTIGVLGKYLQCIQTQSCDQGIAIIQKSDEGESCVEDVDHGRLTVKYLFQFGAEYLARSDLESASSVACCLQQLCQCTQWQSSVSFQITQCLTSLAIDSHHPKLDAIFGVLVFAGFPNVLQMGSIVEMKESGSEQKEVIAFSYSTTKASAIVIDIKSRKKKTVTESSLQEIPFLMELHDATKFSTLLTIIRDILKALKNQDEVSVERLWVFYLVLKAMLSNLKESKCKDLRNNILDADLMPLLVHLACQATDLSRTWLLRDLEILSIKLYKKQLDGGKKVPKLIKTDETEESQVPVPGPEPSFLQTFQDAIQAPLALLESLFDRDGQARILEEVQRSLQEGNLRRIQNQNSTKEKEIPETPDDNSVDIGVVRYSLGELQPKTFKAKEEDQNTCQKLMPSFTEEEITENQRAQARTKSGNLLRSELTKDNPAGFIKKINKALCIMYTRHVLSRVLADWPEGRTLTSEILNSGDEVQLIGILDLLQRIERKDVFETVVTNVVNNGEPTLIQPLSLAAAHCMGEVKLSSETKETEHPYKNNVTEEGKVHIPGAASLSIKFDPRCSSEENCDELTMATSSNFIEHHHEFTGQSGWIDFELPGDTLYFSFQSDSTNTDWGWKFTVTGGQLGRFETGYTILKALLVPDLDLARSLPLQKLWAWLVSVACSQTGQQRLMATGLLLRVLLVSSKLPSDERPELNLLNSLWALYTDMLEKETGGLPPTLVPPALRGLTELFLVVENLAQVKDWGITEELIVGLTTDEALRRCFTQAVWNVGAIGAAIDMPNKATEAAKKALATSQETKKSGKSTLKKISSRNPSQPGFLPPAASRPFSMDSDSSEIETDSFSDGSSGSDN